uniref:Uncharacterized protein n=1 Tax=Arundo donax TaxID=35708 RepID=A0A0A9BM49_ARUDO
MSSLVHIRTARARRRPYLHDCTIDMSLRLHYSIFTSGLCINRLIVYVSTSHVIGGQPPMLPSIDFAWRSVRMGILVNARI